MALNLPTVGSTPGPEWAQKVNDAFDDVDAHDHSSGKGAKITPAGMNIIEDLSMGGNALTNAAAIVFTNNPSLLALPRGLHVVGGDLWYVNGSGAGVQITSGAGLSFSSLGTIGGDFGQPGVTASVSYSDSTKTFSFLRGSGETAKMFTGAISIAHEDAGSLSVEIKTADNTAAYALTLPIAAPVADSVLTFAADGQATFRTITGTAGETTVTPSGSTHQVGLPSTISKNLTLSGSNTYSGANVFTGATSGRGILPLGSVIATFPHLSGAYACAATTAADANGFVQCAGQTIVDATSPMNGVVIPNINNDRFIMGNVTSGTAGGANSKTLSTAELPIHSHTINHGHSNSFALGGTTSFASTGHTHDMSHVHQTRYTNGATEYQTSSNAPGQLSYGTSGTGVQFTETTLFVASGSGTLVFNTKNATAAWYTAGAINSGGGAAQSGGPSATGTVSLSGSVTSHSGSSGDVGSGSSFDIRPAYITARYVMRIK
jgi:hypothetical protein